MHAYLDDKPIQPDRPTLAAALAAGAAMAEDQGRIIVEVTLDGREVEGETLESPPDEDLGDAELRLVTAEPRALACDALADASTQLQSTRKRQAECAELVQSAKLAEAMELMSECLNDWQAARAVVQSVSQLMSVAPQGVEGTIDELAARLDELKAALSGQDWATVADLLAYDLDDQAARWTAMLDEMRRTIEQGT